MSLTNHTAVGQDPTLLSRRGSWLSGGLVLVTVFLALVLAWELVTSDWVEDRARSSRPTVVPIGRAPQGAMAGSVALTRSSAPTGIVMAAVTSEEAITNALIQTNATNWLSYAPPGDSGPAGRAQMIRTGPNRASLSAEVLRSVAAARPGSLWIIGNEPNVVGQDFDPALDLAENAANYIRTFRDARAAIIDADPSARFVLGNVLNFDATCTGCEGQISGRAFLDAVVTAHGDPFPVDAVWGLHAYEIDWDNLPTVRVDQTIREIGSFREFVNTLPGQAGKPIILTELGVIWGFPQLCWEGDQISGCGHALDGDGVGRYLETLIAWLHAHRDSMSIEGWFLFANFANPEPFAVEYGGIALLDSPHKDATLSRFGRIVARLNASTVAVP
ncbi:MAG: hypothetical protein EPO26_12025 [Chloroflexota bacterium]|nr:MAG: hypothetical protein EPO26_12025 [Chloroflexota bacterium]